MPQFPHVSVEIIIVPASQNCWECCWALWTINIKHIPRQQSRKSRGYKFQKIYLALKSYTSVWSTKERCLVSLYQELLGGFDLLWEGNRSDGPSISWEGQRGHRLPISAPLERIFVWATDCLKFLLLTFKAFEGLLPSVLYKLWASPCLQGVWGNGALDFGA